MGVWWNFVFDNSYEQDANEAKAAVRKKRNPLLLHKDKIVEFGFKNRGGNGRDKEYVKCPRILIKDGKGIGSKRKTMSVYVLYASIQVPFFGLIQLDR